MTASKGSAKDDGEVQKFLEQIRKEHGEILAHPMMYVSALHNKEGCYPVDQSDEFFKANGIKFIELVDVTGDYSDEPDMKYVVATDKSGTLRHSVVPNP